MNGQGSRPRENQIIALLVRVFAGAHKSRVLIVTVPGERFANGRLGSILMDWQLRETVDRNRSTRRAKRCLVIGGLVFSACAPDRQVQRYHEVTDSSGVRIEASTAPLWDNATAWSVNLQATLSIGVADGPPEYELSWVAGVTRLRNGSVVLLDGASQELRLFDPNGNFLASVGKRGRGPGEFVHAVSLQPYRGDSIFVQDFSGARISIFDGSLKLGRSISTAQTGLTRYWWKGPTSDSLFVLYTTAGPQLRGPNLAWDSTYMIVVEPSGTRADTLGRWPLGQGSRVHDVYFATYAYFAPSKRGFFWATANQYAIGEYRPDGTLVRIIRRPWKPVRVTPAMIEAYSDRRAEASEGSGRVLHPDHLPAFSGLLTDATGNLWVRHYDFLHEDATTPVWDVFGSAGEWLCTVSMPPDLRIVMIGADYVLGIATDSLGVQSVRLHHLRKP